jgi:hypothetical protein
MPLRDESPAEPAPPTPEELDALKAEFGRLLLHRRQPADYAWLFRRRPDGALTVETVELNHGVLGYRPIEGRA